MEQTVLLLLNRMKAQTMWAMQTLLKQTTNENFEEQTSQCSRAHK